VSAAPLPCVCNDMKLNSIFPIIPVIPSIGNMVLPTSEYCQEKTYVTGSSL
jgi:hypothetical protein